MSKPASLLLPLRVMARRLRVSAIWLRTEAAKRRVLHLKAGSALLFDSRTVERILAERARREGIQ